MRLRYKKNLEERADACSNYFIDRTCPDSAVDAINNPNYVDFKALFNNDNPVVLEIGCGKGKFAIEYAQKHPDQNVIAVERLIYDYLIITDMSQQTFKNVQSF